MPLQIVILICEDPTKSHRPVEALRIALGLSTGPNPLTIIVTGKARLLLTEDVSDLVDSEILEKHLPVVQELGLKILVQENSQMSMKLIPIFRSSRLPQKTLRPLFLSPIVYWHSNE